MSARLLTQTRGADWAALVLLGLLAAAAVVKLAALASPGNLDLPALYGSAHGRR